MNFQNITRKQIIVIFLAVAIPLAVLGGYFAWRETTMSKLVIEIAPSDASLFIGTKEIKSPGTVYVKPGKYTLYFTRKDFSSFQRDYQLDKGKSTQFYVALSPVNDAGKKYLKDNPGINAQLERVGGKQDNANTDSLTTKYPLITKLPGVGRDFTIDFNQSSEQIKKTELTIRIRHVGESGKQQALQWIRDKGFNPADYQIEYIDLLVTQPRN